MPLHKYIQRRRVERALQIIMKDSAIALERLASEVGVDDVAELSALFIRLIGISPSEYRAALLFPEGRSADTTSDRIGYRNP